MGEAEHHLSKVAEANKNCYAALRGGGDLEASLKKLLPMESYVRVGAKDGIPPMHTEALMLYSNLANCNFFLATRDKERPDMKALELFHKYKKISIERFEQKHGDWTNQRDVDYFQLIYHTLQAKGLSEADRQAYAVKLAGACQTNFGQCDIPKTIAEYRGRPS